MNMNTEKKQTYSRNRLAVAIVAILLLGVAMIGIGYATNHTGTLTNATNTTTEEYIILDKDVSDTALYTGAFNNTFEFNTVNNAGNVTRTITNESTSISVNSENVAAIKLGTKTITVTQGDNPSAYTLNVKADKNLSSSYLYYVGFTYSGATEYDVAYSTTDGATSSLIPSSVTSVTVTLYVQNIENNSDFTKILDNVTFTFTATVDSSTSSQ